jgi:hypothetical protein
MVRAGNGCRGLVNRSVVAAAAVALVALGATVDASSVTGPTASLTFTFAGEGVTLVTLTPGG